jgi:hypothetical protein
LLALLSAARFAVAGELIREEDAERRARLGRFPRTPGSRHAGTNGKIDRDERGEDHERRDEKRRAFVIVPMAPFKLSTRPIVVPADSSIRFEIAEPTRPGLLVLDGQKNIEVYHKDEIEFTLSKNTASFVRFGRDFYKRVDEKLRF